MTDLFITYFDHNKLTVLSETKATNDTSNLNLQIFYRESIA